MLAVNIVFRSTCPDIVNCFYCATYMSIIFIPLSLSYLLIPGISQLHRAIHPRVQKSDSKKPRNFYATTLKPLSWKGIIKSLVKSSAFATIFSGRSMLLDWPPPDVFRSEAKITETYLSGNRRNRISDNQQIHIKYLHRILIAP